MRCLSDDEALTLFIDKVEVNIFGVPALKDIVKLVVEQCARLPLAIVTVACCMRREYDICEWRNALEELSKSIQSVKGMETNVLGQLQFSYDCLKSKNVQHCFFYCALYPKYFKIPKEELIVYWIAEGLVDERASLQATYDGAYSILNRLVNNCLLETIDDGRCVKMHDLIREMALDITSMSPLFMVKAGEKLQEFPREQEWKENLEKASLMRNNILEIPPNMMQGLNILNLSYTIIEKLPDSISHLTNLTALLLQYCEHIKHVPCLAKLSCLRNLDLEGTQITEVSEGMEMLQKLRYLNLFSVYLEKLPAGMLSKLNCVQKLRVYWGSKTSEEMVEEASKLSELDILEACFRKIEDFKIYVKSLGSGVGRFVEFNVNFVAPPKDLQCLTLNYCNTVTSLSDVLSNEGDYSDLKAVHVRYCKNLKELLSAKLLRALPNLEVIEVSSCNEIEEIIRLDVGEEKSEEDGRSNTTLNSS
ncbi:probable disease resistance protein At4g27220 [Pistacia vera]|uniref:probable disease resistance protein At4g27220 n=1 Tax=Pistacia vera TaxID=55513 RepID=UPI0012638776|nr:probable disease resistance protein At4g27220 [Pistacia vera]